MAVAKFGSGNASLFATHRTGGADVVLDEGLLKQVTDLLTNDPHAVIAQEHVTATKDETDKYNTLRESAWGKRAAAAAEAGKPLDPAGAPKSKTIAGMAVVKASAEAATVKPYVESVVDSMTPAKSYSLRFVNQGTAEKPSVLWAFVLVNKRAPKTPKTETPTA